MLIVNGFNQCPTANLGIYSKYLIDMGNIRTATLFYSMKFLTTNLALVLSCIRHPKSGTVNNCSCLCQLVAQNDL